MWCLLKVMCRTVSGCGAMKLRYCLNRKKLTSGSPKAKINSGAKKYIFF